MVFEKLSVNILLNYHGNLYKYIELASAQYFNFALIIGFTAKIIPEL